MDEEKIRTATKAKVADASFLNNRVGVGKWE